jgi:hypothetical protein
VRLFSNLTVGGWQFTDYTYQAATGAAKAVLTTPTPASTLAGSSVQFQWTAGTGVAGYWLAVGTTPGGANLFYADPGGLSQTVSNLPTGGGTIYVRLFSNIAGGWQFTDYTYQAATQ